MGSGATSSVLLSIIFIAFGSSYATQLSLVVSNATELQLSPGVVVEQSPGAKPGTKLLCERIKIHGLSRLKNLEKFADSVKVKVSYVNPSSRPLKAEVCFHRNASLGVGMCRQEQWQKLLKGTWVGSMSPYDHKLLDICMAGSSLEPLQVSLDDEFFVYRIIFLVLGVAMMTFASSLSQSLVFYYSGAMTVGILLVILMVLFQGMKLLPTGRKNSFAIFAYSCIIGVGSSLLHYVPNLLRSVLVEVGVSEDMYNPLAIFLVVFLLIAGAWLGFWVVRKLVIKEDGKIDIGVAHFVDWSIRIVASVMIIQSSVDPLLAAEALACSIVVTSLLRRLLDPKLINYLFRTSHRGSKSARRKSRDFSSSPIKERHASPRTPVSLPAQGSASKSAISSLLDTHTFYSTFHETPDRKKFSKDDWDEFTKASTKRALEDLVISPDFNKWAVANAERITLTPATEDTRQRRKWFFWF
ncbi:hypothetical protein LIER_06795 [Lithospermum erythrorhizon]|uniref:Uncharacterized protein n=1 Tax=Lithospermum erythrorhizon TaxID=34254 RepID=A0AAV3P7M7_LITER